MMQFDHVNLRKESPNPLDRYPLDIEITNAMMKDSIPSALFHNGSPQESKSGSVGGYCVQCNMCDLAVQSPIDSQIGSEEEMSNPN